jgi:5'-3' exonuclease
LQKYASIEEIYENIEQIEPISVRQKLQCHKEKAFLSKVLDTLESNCPIDFCWTRWDLYSAWFQEGNMKEKAKIFEEKGFSDL